jgi:Protein of unknown function (DUF2000)
VTHPRRLRIALAGQRCYRSRRAAKPRRGRSEAPRSLLSWTNLSGFEIPFPGLSDARLAKRSGSPAARGLVGQRRHLLSIDFPTDCQQTNDYDEVRRRVAAIPTTDLRYLAILLCGPRRAVNRLTGNLALLR